MKRRFRTLVVFAALAAAVPAFADGPGGNDPPPPASGSTATSSSTAAALAALLAWLAA